MARDLAELQLWLWQCRQCCQWQDEGTRRVIQGDCAETCVPCRRAVGLGVDDERYTADKFGRCKAPFPGCNQQLPPWPWS